MYQQRNTIIEHHQTPMSNQTGPPSSPPRSSLPKTPLNRIESRAHQRYHQLRSPLSSPLKNHTAQMRSTRTPTRDEPRKYTLRGTKYVPFAKRQEARAQRQLDQRGGLDSMERFVVLHQKKREDEQLKRQADLVAQTWEELDDIQEETTMDPYERELEMMLQREEQELEALMNDMTI